MTLSSQEKHLFFTLFILSHASNNTTSPNIGGDQCMGHHPTSNLGGPSPQCPARTPPLVKIKKIKIQRKASRLLNVPGNIIPVLLIAVALPFRYCSGASFIVSVVPLLLAES